MRLSKFTATKKITLFRAGDSWIYFEVSPAKKRRTLLANDLSCFTHDKVTPTCKIQQSHTRRTLRKSIRVLAFGALLT